MYDVEFLRFQSALAEAVLWLTSEWECKEQSATTKPALKPAVNTIVFVRQSQTEPGPVPVLVETLTHAPPKPPDSREASARGSHYAGSECVQEGRRNENRSAGMAFGRMRSVL